MKQRKKTHRRGRTRASRMALLDRLFDQRCLTLPKKQANLVADVGFGDSPGTTLRWHQTLLALDPAVETIGVEVDETRVLSASRELTRLTHLENQNLKRLSFRRGGFDFWTTEMPEVSVIRCMNVLRGYGIDSQLEAKRRLMRGLRVGGLLLEGTTDTEGHLLACHIYERRERIAQYRALVLATNFKRGFSPWMFRDVLPRDLRRHVHEGEPIWELLTAWDAVVTAQRAKNTAVQSNARIFEISLSSLAETRNDVSTAQEQWAHGCLLFTPDVLSSRNEVLRTGVVVNPLV